MKKPFCENNKEILEHVDLAKPVRAYRNIHRKCISIKQDGIVRCWATNVVLENCKFIVSKAGQKRVRDEKKKKEQNSSIFGWTKRILVFCRIKLNKS